MARFNPKYKVTVRWYTVLVIVLIIVMFVVGYVTNKSEEAAPKNEESEAVSHYTSEDISNELAKRGITLDNSMLGDSEESSWGRLLVVDSDAGVYELRFEIEVFPRSDGTESGVIADRIKASNEKSNERIDAFLTANRKALVNGGIIKNASAKRVNTVLAEIEKVINSADDYVWVWGDYTYRAERLDTDGKSILIIHAQFEG